MADLTPDQQAAIDAVNKKNAEIDNLKKSSLSAISASYDADRARMQSNLDNAMLRASAAAAKGDTVSQQRWLASADRYGQLINIKNNLEESKLKITSQQFDNQKQRAPIFYSFDSDTNVKKNDSRVSPLNNPPPSPVPVTPTTVAPTPVAPSIPPVPVKTAPIDTILYPSDDLLPVEIMADLIFENIGGHELINIARTDTVNGQPVVYQPIKNLTQIQQQYNPNNILSLQSTSDKYFQNFSIKLESKIPNIGNGPDGEHVYIDPFNGSLVIEAINLEPDEQIEVEITTSGTIYEAEL